MKFFVLKLVLAGATLGMMTGAAGTVYLPMRRSSSFGFRINVVADALGANRHLVVNNNGDIYVKLEGWRKCRHSVLRDTDKDGRYEVVNSFASYKGTGIAIRNGYLYASSNEEVFRYKLNAKNEVENRIIPRKSSPA